MSEDVNTDLSYYNVKIISTILTDNYVGIVFEGNNLHGDYNFPNCTPVLAQVIKDLMYTLDASSWEKITGSYCRVLAKGCDVIGIKNIVTDKELTFNAYVDPNKEVNLAAALGNAQAMFSGENIAKRREEHKKKLTNKESTNTTEETTQDNPNTTQDNDN